MSTEEAIPTTENVIVAPPKRKRGRPRKNPLPEAMLPVAPVAEAGVLAPPAPSAPPAQPAAESGESKKPAKRVTKRAAKAAAEAAAAAAETPVPAAEQQLALGAPAPERQSAPPVPAPQSVSAPLAPLPAPFDEGRPQQKRSFERKSFQNNKNGHQQNNYQPNNRRPRRPGANNNGNNNNAGGQVTPRTTREDLAELKIAELRAKAAELELDISEIRKKDELLEAVLSASIRAEGFVECVGVFDSLPEGYGFLRTSGYLPGEKDVYVGQSMVRRNGLRKGDLIAGQTCPSRDNGKYVSLNSIATVNGLSVEEARSRRRFADLTPVYPDERLVMEHGQSTITARTIDLVAPIGKGQRGLIVSPPKAGKTTILKDIAAAISANNPDVHLMCLLVDERPEEVTDMQRSIKGEVVSSTFDMPSENHIAVAELVIERAKRLVEGGRDVVILLDSITRLARAYNLAQPASGRILSGGVDSTALYPPKRFLGAARNIEGGGSLTILASALIDTGSKMDEVIFEEFKGTGNMELKLDRALADRRIFPAIDPVSSGTRKEELLLDAQEAPLIWAVRRILANMNNTERSMEMLIKSLKQTHNNEEFLMRTAKKAQQRSTAELAEL